MNPGGAAALVPQVYDELELDRRVVAKAREIFPEVFSRTTGEPTSSAYCTDREVADHLTFDWRNRISAIVIWEEIGAIRAELRRKI
jgi:hypothetical protein